MNKGKRKKEDTILAEFHVSKYHCQYDGLCWMLNEDGVTNHQCYYSSIESICCALLNKLASGGKASTSIAGLLQSIQEAKQEILNAVKFIEYPQENR
jgi:hypothetical protein